MSAGGASYEITVRGLLDDHWSERLAGLRLVPGADGSTVLKGTLADQAQLHGVLATLRDIGVELLGLRCVALRSPGGGQTGGRPVHEALAHDNGIPRRTQ